MVFADNHAEHTQRAGEILDIEHAARLKRRRQHRQSLSMGGDEGTIHRPRSGVMLGPPAPSRCQTAEEIPSSLSLLTVYRRHLSPRPFRAVPGRSTRVAALRSEEHTSELQSLMRISYAVFCLKTIKNILH